MWQRMFCSYIAVPCPKLNAPSGGTITVPTSPVYQDSARVSCQTGYYLQGSATRMCQASGKWSGAAPKCPSRLTQLQMKACLEHNLTKM